MQNMQNIQNIQNMHDMQNMQNMQNIPNMRNMQRTQNMQDRQNTQNMQNRQNMQNMQNRQNIPPLFFSSKDQKSKISESESSINSRTCLGHLVLLSEQQEPCDQDYSLLIYPESRPYKKNIIMKWTTMQRRKNEHKDWDKSKIKQHVSHVTHFSSKCSSSLP